MIEHTDSFDARVAVPFGADMQTRVRIAAAWLVEIIPFYPGGRVR